MNSNSRYLFFAHDAGSANMIVAYAYFLKNKANKDIFLYPKGPAVEICNRYLKQYTHLTEVDFIETDIVLTGLSWIITPYEIEIIQKAKGRVKKIITILDCEYNFEERFIKDGKLISYLPDKIFAPKNIVCENSILKEKIVYVDNIYKKFIKKYVLDSLINENSEYILILTEYVKEQYGYEFGYTEYEFLDSLLSVLDRLKVNMPLYIKMPPAEYKNLKKYNYIIDKYKNLNIIIKNSEDVYELIVNAKVIFGIHTSLFQITNVLNKKAYSVQINKIKDFEFIPKTIPIIDNIDKLEKIIKGFIDESDG